MIPPGLNTSMNPPLLIPRRLSLLACAAALAFLNSCQVTPPVPGAETRQRQEGNAPRLTMDKAVYRVGELMTCTVTPSVDCRLTLSIQMADGRRRMIYPNPLAGGGRIFAAGRTVRFPDSEDYQFRVTGPTGSEQLIVQATGTTAEAFPPAAQSQSTLPEQIPAEAEGRTSPAATPPAADGEARVVYRVIP
ncbi:MAG: DUF4384 domain-containing protein [Verrucomicrobiaceae bacterium]|nr:MAG: DUF4384 domain-containing protein [Verrucomicrobiaceae bacterium]